MKNFAILFIVLTFFSVANSKAQWQPISGNKALEQSVISIIKSVDGFLFTGTWGNGAFMSKDGGETWFNLDSGISQTANILDFVETNGYVFSSVFGNAVVCSKDTGRSWNKVGKTLNCNNISSLAAVNGLTFAGSLCGGIYITPDSGKIWVRPDNELISLNVNTIMITHNKIFAGTFDSSVFVSQNNSATWILSSNGIEGKMSVLLYSYMDNIYDITNDGLYKSTDDGANWQLVCDTTGKNLLSSIACYGNNIFLSSNTGVYLSSNNGVDWKQVNNGLTNIQINTLLIHNGRIFAGTSGNGIFRANLSDFGISDIKENTNSEKPIMFFPNPATDYILLNTDSDNFRVNIYNSLFIEVSNVQNEKRIDVSKLPPGIYFWRFITGNFEETGEVAIIR